MSDNTRPKQYEYLELDSIWPGGYQEDLTPLKSVRTIVYTGADKKVENDGIHLQHQVEQEITQGPRPSRVSY